MSIDPSQILGPGADIATFVGLGATFVQWLISSKTADHQGTIQDYLEWLRRQNHNELLELLSRSESHLKIIEELLDRN